MAANIYC